MGGSSKPQIIGYKYFAAIHMILCHGKIDSIKKIVIDENTTLIEGNYPNGSYGVNSPNLFGGEKKQGGIVGKVTLMDGSDYQEIPAELREMQGKISGPQNVPSYRGVASILLSGTKTLLNNNKGMYLGTNPFLKNWKTLAQRIMKKSDGSEQWYVEKAAINTFDSGDVLPFSFTLAADPQTAYGSVTQTNSWKGSYSPDDDGFYKFIHTQNDLPNPEVSSNVVAGETLAYGSSKDELTRSINILLVMSGINEQVIAVSIQFYKETILVVPNGFVETSRSVSSSRVTVKGEIYFDRTSSFTFSVNNDAKSSSVTSLSVELGNVYPKTGFLDMNPAHIIRESLVNYHWGSGIGEDEIDNESFIIAANTLYDEKLGMSIKWTQEGSVEEFIQEIKRHINAVVYEDHRTGLQTLKLIRKDYIVDELRRIDKNDIMRVSDFQKSIFGDLINQITVTYTNVVDGSSGTVTVQDTALVAAQGAVNSKSVKYIGFSNISNAGRAGMRDLKSYATPLISAKITVKRSSGISFRQGDVFIWDWPAYGVNSIVMRISEIDLGDAKRNSVILNCLQDIFAIPDSTVTTIQPEVPTNNVLAPVSDAEPMEVPYISMLEILGSNDTQSAINDNPDVGFYGIAVSRPDGGPSSDALLSIKSLSSGNWVQSSVVNFCTSFAIVDNIDQQENIIQVPMSSIKDFELITIEDYPILALIGNEILSIDSMSITGQNADICQFNITRSVSDTVPEAHESGDVLYMFGLFLGYSSTEYNAGETVSGKVVTQSISSSSSFDSAAEFSVTMDSRAVRPYPPANVKISGQYAPEMVSSYINVSLRHRNKVLQNTVPVGWFDDSSTLIPEGLQYQIEVYIDNNLIDEQIFDAAENINFVSEKLFSGDVTLKIYSLLDGYKSLYPVEKYFYYTVGVATPINLRAEVY